MCENPLSGPLAGCAAQSLGPPEPIRPADIAFIPDAKWHRRYVVLGTRMGRDRSDSQGLAQFGSEELPYFRLRSSHWPDD